MATKYRWAVDGYWSRRLGGTMNSRRARAHLFECDGKMTHLRSLCCRSAYVTLESTLPVGQHSFCKLCIAKAKMLGYVIQRGEK